MVVLDTVVRTAVEPPGDDGQEAQDAVTSQPTPTPTDTAEPTPSDEATVTVEPTPVPTSSVEPTPDPTTTPAEPQETPAATVSPEPTSEPSSSPSPTTTATVQVPVWPSRPAVTESSVPWGVVVVALVVLVAAAAGLWWWWRRFGAREAQVRAGSAAVRPSAPGGAWGETAGDDAPTVVLPVPDEGADDLHADAPTVVLPRASDRVDVATEPTGRVDDTTYPVDVATGAAPGAAPGAADDVPRDTPDATPLTAHADASVRFLVRLGEAMVDAGSPIVQVDATLRRVAEVNGLPDVAVVTFPTALMVSVPQHDTVQTAVSGAGTRVLRLDQVGDVLHLADAAARGDVRPRAGLVRLDAIVRSEPASTALRRSAGYVTVAAGLSLVLGGGWLDVLVAAVLGGAVAVLTALTRRVPAVYQGLLVAVCAFAVAVPVLLLVRTGWSVGLLAPLVAPLVTFLPGALLTTGVIDLATRQMIAGSARLAAGVMQLVLLALGITAAAGLVGVPAADVGSGGGQPLGWAGPWIGVLVYAVGVVLHNDAHRGALPWITLVLVVAYAGQVLGGVLLGAVVSSFVGALAMTPVAMLAATRPSGPPFLVTFLPGFWVLVPGALGLVGVTSAIGHSTDQAVTTIVTTGVSMVAISLGVLAGLALGGGLQRRLAPDAPRIV